MTDYPVNLPKTSFPMRANLAKREPEFLKLWQEIDLYKKILEKNKNNPKFILHDGPPYANGDIHMGHAIDKILKDIIVKARTYDGCLSPYIPGWDCHGLPIEIQIEKKLGKALRADKEKWIGECRKYAAEQIDSQSKDFQRLGVIGDWQEPYKTFNFKYEADVIRALAQVVANGYLARGYKPVHWCVACGSALAEAEVEYKDKTSPAIDVRFRVVEPEKIVDCCGKISIPIWTTTPWTLPANEAVALHPDHEYVLVDCERHGTHDCLIIAKLLLEKTMQRYEATNYKIIKSFSGKDLERLQLQHPFLARTVPVILGEHVTVEDGTGAVHTAPAHGQEDFAIGKIYKLPVKNPVGPDGKFLADTEYFAGEEVFHANDHVIEILREENNLLCLASVSHSYPHCWRHKTPLIFRATEQWFIGLDAEGKFGKLRDLAISEIQKVKWVPESGLHRIQNMIGQRPDWCISRQRLWGTPMPLFIHKTTQKLHPKTYELMEKVAEGIEQEGIIFWHKIATEQFLKEHAPEYSASATDYYKSSDTLDVWFDSGVSHFCVASKRSELQFPIDLYIEGSDQYRGWFQSSLLTSLAMHGRAPYGTVISHGFTVDAHGHKMSKSLGNVIAPRKVIDALGADIIRLWIASIYIFNDLAVSDEILQRNVDAYRNLRNMARFLLGNLSDFNPKTNLIAPQNMLAIDRYAVKLFFDLQEKFIQHYQNYQFFSAYNYLQNFVTIEVSSFYFNVIKDRLYTMSANSVGRRSAQTALFYMLEIFVRIIAPVLSFTAEEIWQELRKLHSEREESVFLTTWYNEKNAADFALQNDLIKMDDWQTLQKLRAEINKILEKLRLDGKIGSSLEAEVVLYCDGVLRETLQKLGDELRFVLLTSDAKVKSLAERSDAAIATDIPDFFVAAGPSVHKKCCRCWHYRSDVGESAKHPELCGRCVDNVEGVGENRRIA